MAFAFGFPQNVTDLICSMRDWRWEMVRQCGKTPSAQCFNIGIPWITHDPDEKPVLFPLNIPYYHVELDSEDPDVGEIVLDRWNRYRWNRIGIVCEPSDRSFTLRDFRGRVPAEFRTLQRESDDRINEMWFQSQAAPLPLRDVRQTASNDFDP